MSPTCWNPPTTRSPRAGTRAVSFGLAALAPLPQLEDLDRRRSWCGSRRSPTALADQRRLETDLARRTPDGLRVALDITAPRPAITPFTLRFVIDAAGRARFDACSADTAPARDAIVKAAVAAGMTGKANCVIGLGAPSPRWGEAAALAIGAVHDLGGGAVTLSDADVSLVAPDTTPKALFDTVAGTLEQQPARRLLAARGADRAGEARRHRRRRRPAGIRRHPRRRTARCSCAAG